MYYYDDGDYQVIVGLFNDFFADAADDLSNYISYNDHFGVWQVKDYEGWLNFLGGLFMPDDGPSLDEVLALPGWSDFGISGQGGGNL